MKHWKLSPMDTESVRRWWDYTAAYQRMIKATHTPWAPWHIGRRQEARAAESHPSSARQHPIQEGRYRSAEEPQGAAAAHEYYRGPGPADSQSLLMLARVVRGRSREVHSNAKTAPVPSAPPSTKTEH